MESDSSSYSQGSKKTSSLGRSTEEYAREILGNFLNSKNKPVNKANLLRKICMYIKSEIEINQDVQNYNQEENYQKIKSRTLINKLKANDISEILKSEHNIMYKLLTMENSDMLKELNIYCSCGARHSDREEQCCKNIKTLQDFIAKIAENDICNHFMN